MVRHECLYAHRQHRVVHAVLCSIRRAWCSAVLSMLSIVLCCVLSTGVGVSGFSLHGGVHFGALSELYGLSADNLMGAIVVLPDGAVVDVIEEEQMEHMHMMTGGSSSVTTKRCSIKNTRLHRQLVHTQAIAYSYDEDMVYVDHTITPGNWSCSQLMEALRGAGSNVGVVVTLVLKLHPYPNKHCSRLDRYRLVDKAVPPDDGRIISSLAVVSVSVGEEEGGDVRAAYLLKALLAAFPDAVSVTLFGLDAFFKAYMFVMRFADPAGQWKALGHSYRGWNMLSAVKNNSKHVIHFVVEATWLHSSTISIEELTSAVSVLLKRQEGRPTAALTVPFVQSPEPWSVPSYNLVWGKGHRYAGASLTVGPSGSECGHASNFSRAGHCKGDIALLVVLMEGFVSYRRSKGVCSDCVTVLHRVGEGIRRGGLDRGGGEGEGIFHPYRRSSVLWAEVDCGLFYRHDHRYRQSITSVDNGIVRRGSSAWDQCENWLGTVQSAMETAAAVGQRFHYINVPNKHSAQSAGDHDSSDGHSSQIIADTWVEMHISSLHFDRLRKLLDAIDPTGLFSNKSFVRTLPTSNTPLTALITSATTADTSVCVNLYRKHAFEDAVLAVKVSLALLLLRLSAAPAVHHLLKPMMQRLVAAAMR